MMDQTTGVWTRTVPFLGRPRKVWEIPILVITYLVLVMILYVVLQSSTIYPPKSRAKESMFKVNLMILRNAISSFKKDTGKYPYRLEDINPYLKREGSVIPGTAIPVNNFVKKSTSDPDISHHWIYNSQTGEIHSTVKGIDADGKPYSEY